jgi:hypothetical protein
MHNDLATWGFFLSILGILLVIPLTMLGNLLTRKFENWWAARSKATLLTRIAKLKSRLEKCEQSSILDETQSYILEGIELLIIFLITSSSVLLYTILSTAYKILKGYSLHGPTAFFLVVIVTDVILLLKVYAPRAQWRLDRSAHYRTDLRTQVSKLETKAAKQ